MRNKTSCISLALLLLFTLSSCAPLQGKAPATTENDIEFVTAYDIPFVAHETSFYLGKSNSNTYSPFFIKGINIGQTLPDTDMGDLSLPHNTYLEWFDLIRKVNINTIKVFDIMDENFYNALKEHNEKNKKSPLYLVQGVWVNGGDYSSWDHAYSNENELSAAYISAVKKAVDVLHGQYYRKNENINYTSNVSMYTLGYVIGSEWDPAFVKATNDEKQEQHQFSGNYLYTENALPFETFLCEIGDALISYETQNYDAQHPVSFLNWASTDILNHEDEPFAYDDMVSVNTEAIIRTENYEAGLFAAVDVYPYYPEFMNYQRRYIDNNDGEINSFAAYLDDLKKEYTIPLVVAEFGLSTSRGQAHKSTMDYHQGMLNETQQGEYVLSMMEDIHKLDLAGGFIFNWQDEWFKHTWNTVKVQPSGARHLNVQSAEQRYGIVAYEPGDESPACLPDGSDDEWKNVNPHIATEQFTISFKNDEAYFYVLARSLSGKSLDETGCAIAIGTTDGRGNTFSSEHGLTFEKPTDFLLMLDGYDSSRLLTAGNSDIFHWMLTRNWKTENPDSKYEEQNNGLFGPIRMLLSGPMNIPYENEARSWVAYEAGLLRHGNANPESNDFDSLADYCFGEDFVEIRLPWSLLNILDPAAPMRTADFFSNEVSEIELEPIDGIWVGITPLNKTPAHVTMEKWELSGYEQACYHLRLKESYWILQEGLENL